MKKGIHLKDKDEKGNVYANYVTCHGGGERWWGQQKECQLSSQHCSTPTAREVGKKGSLDEEGGCYIAGLEKGPGKSTGNKKTLSKDKDKDLSEEDAGAED